MSIIDTSTTARLLQSGADDIARFAAMALQQQNLQDDRNYRDQLLTQRRQEMAREEAQRQADRALATQQFDVFSALTGGIGSYGGQVPEMQGPPSPGASQAPQMPGVSRGTFAAASPQAQGRYLDDYRQMQQQFANQRRLDEGVARKQQLAGVYEPLIRNRFGHDEQPEALALLDTFVNTNMTPDQFEDQLRQMQQDSAAKRYAYQRYQEQNPGPDMMGVGLSGGPNAEQYQQFGQYAQNAQDFSNLDPSRQAQEYGRWDRNTQNDERMAQQMEIAKLRAAARKGGAVVPYATNEEMLATFPNLANVVDDMRSRYNAGAITFNDLQQENNRRGGGNGNSQRRALLDRINVDSDQFKMYEDLIEKDPANADKHRAAAMAAFNRLRDAQKQLIELPSPRGGAGESVAPPPSSTATPSPANGDALDKILDSLSPEELAKLLRGE